MGDYPLQTTHLYRVLVVGISDKSPLLFERLLPYKTRDTEA